MVGHAGRRGWWRRAALAAAVLGGVGAVAAADPVPLKAVMVQPPGGGPLEVRYVTATPATAPAPAEVPAATPIPLPALPPADPVAVAVPIPVYTPAPIPLPPVPVVSPAEPVAATVPSVAFVPVPPIPVVLPPPAPPARPGLVAWPVTVPLVIPLAPRTPTVVPPSPPPVVARATRVVRMDAAVRPAFASNPRPAIRTAGAVMPLPPPPALASEEHFSLNPAADEGLPAVACADGKCGRGGKGGSCDCFACAKAPATVLLPLGTAVRSATDLQRMNALAEYFVVYREDWLENAPTLNPTGVRHLSGIVRRLGMVPAPIRVEPSGIADLDDRRRLAITGWLLEAGVSTAEAAGRVVIGGTRAEGLRYTDIERVYGREVSGGGGGGGGGGGFGGGNGFGGGTFGGGGFGGGGFGGGGFGGGGFGGFR